MPEGPEIRRAADRIGKALVGKVIEDGQWPYPSLEHAKELILGHEVLNVTSRAKAMLIRFSLLRLTNATQFPSGEKAAASVLAVPSRRRASRSSRLRT